MKANHHPTSLTLLESMMGLAIFSIAPWADLNKHSAAQCVRRAPQNAVPSPAPTRSVHAANSDPQEPGTVRTS
jgi:hypothetical protein